MIDSGSAVTIANCAKHFGTKYKVVPGEASRNGMKYSNASGGEIINRGETLIPHKMPDGTTLWIPFQDADVQCPIISVRDYAKIGSIVKFKRDGGSIKMTDGRVLRFQERCGVYWTLLDLGDVADDEDDAELPDLVDAGEPLCTIRPDDPPVSSFSRPERSKGFCASFCPPADSCSPSCLCQEPETDDSIGMNCGISAENDAGLLPRVFGRPVP